MRDLARTIARTPPSFLSFSLFCNPMLSTTLVYTLLLTLAASAKPIVLRDGIVSLPLAKQLNMTGIRNLLQHDQSRAKSLLARIKAVTEGISLGDGIPHETVSNTGVSYVASVGVGNPATICMSPLLRELRKLTPVLIRQSDC